jgi:hypothetical protein
MTRSHLKSTDVILSGAKNLQSFPFRPCFGEKSEMFVPFSDKEKFEGLSSALSAQHDRLVHLGDEY